MSRLLIMACSATKRGRATRALHLYRGVMYTTFHTHAGTAPPAVIILSAEHGFVGEAQVIEPYNRMMNQAGSDRMIAELDRFNHVRLWPASSEVMLAGGELYRRVMRAAVAKHLPRAKVIETTGALGQQRSQLGAWLRKGENTQ